MFSYLNKSWSTLATICLFSHMGMSQITLTGTETQVNTTTANSQIEAAVSIDTAGNAVVVWSSFLQDSDDYGIYFQRYDATGAAAGSETAVNTSFSGGQRHPDVTSSDAGYTIVWQDETTDGDGYGIYRRSYNASGSAISSQARVNSTTTGNQQLPQVASDVDGNFTVVWMSEGTDGDDYGIYRRRYLANTAALESQVLVNATTAGYQGHPAIGMNHSGVGVIAWQSADTDDHGIYAQVYDNSGVVTVSEFLVNSTETGNQQNPAVAVNNNGDFMIVWSSMDQDGDHYGIYGQLFNSSGTAIGSEFLINSTTASTQDNASIAATSSGSFVVSWTGFDSDGDKAGVYARTFGPTGTAAGTEVQINTTTNEYQQLSDVAVFTETHNAVIAWQDGNRSSSTSADGDDYGIFIQTADIIDNIDPVAVCQNITVYLDGSGNVSITAADVDGGSSDNIGITSYAINTSSFTCADIGANTVTLTVSDAEGNSDNCTATVTVQDTISPTASCQNITVYLDGTGNASITSADVDNGSSDNCSTPSLGIDVSSFTCANIGANTVTLTATDAEGNSSTCTATVTVQDTISPTASCQNITAYLDGSGNATITAADIDNGSSDNCGTPSLSISQSSFTCSDIGANTVTLTATDGGSNTSTCTATVTILDTISPTVACQNITVYLDGSGNATITAADVDNGSSDNCGTPSLGIDVSSFTCANIGANTVNLTATDGSSNSSSCSATVTVLDTISPVVSCQNLTVYLNAAGNATITTGDIDNGSTDNCGTPSLSLDLSTFTCTNVGTNTVTLTGTDGSSNSSTCTATVTVLDTISPTASCQNITVYLDGTGNASITAGDIDNGSTDNCGTPSLGIDVSTFSCTDLGTNTVTLTATDASSNASTCTATVTVLDTISPVMTCQNITVYVDGSGNASITATDIDNGSSDNCSVPTLSIDVSSFTCSDLGANTVVLTGTDANSNSSTCSATVTVLDTISPTVSNCPTDISINTNNTGCTGIATWTAPTFNDNCSFTSTSTHNSGDVFPVGITTVTYTVSDPSGNSNTCQFTVTVTDDIAVVLDSTNDALCFGSADGQAFITPTGGSGTYTYDWDFDGTGDTDDNEDELLSAGTWNVTVTDANGCTTSTSAVIGEPTQVAVVLDSITQPDCGQSDGAAYITISGGTPNYIFDWDNDGTGDNDDTEDLLNIPAGTYTVIGIDANGCTDTLDVNVSNPFGPTLTSVSTDVLCFQDTTGAIDLTVSSTIPYTIDWDNDGTGDNDDTEDLMNLGAGVYTVTVVDTNNCSISLSDTINSPSQIMTTEMITPPTCLNDSDAVVTLTVSGGTPGYDVMWFNNDTTLTVDSLSAGTYTFSIMDANSCVLTDSVTITDPTFSATIDVTDISCNGEQDGEITVTPVGGTPNYTILWSTTDTTFTIDSLMMGTYSFVWTDSNGCVYEDSATIVEPAALSLSAVSTDEMFGNDGTIDLTVSGGTPGYTYDWDNDGTGDNDDTEDLNSLVSGNYTVIVIDTNGCSDTLTIDVGSQVGVFENDANDFVLYPNPTNGQFYIEFNTAISKPSTLEVLDARGRLVMSSTLGSAKKHLIDLDLVERGTYLIKISSDDAVLSKQIIVQ